MKQTLQLNVTQTWFHASNNLDIMFLYSLFHIMHNISMNVLRDEIHKLEEKRISMERTAMHLTDKLFLAVCVSLQLAHKA